MSTILVTGATGRQGSSIISALLALPSPPHLIKALTRTPTSPSALTLASKSPSLQLVEGSFSTLQPHLSDVDAIYLMSENASSGPEGEIAQGVDFTNAIKSHLAKASKPLHVVYTTVDGANRGTGLPHFESKGKIEEMLKEAVGEKNLTILRPAAFMDGLPKAPGETLSPFWGAFDAVLGDLKVKWIAVHDIGRIGALALTNPAEYGRKSIELAGEEITLSEIQDVYLKVHGVRPTLPKMSKDQALRILPPSLAATLTWIANGGEDIADVEQLRMDYPGLYTFEDCLRS